MTRRNCELTLLLVFVAAAILRIFAWTIDPPTCPDEFFQYVEPAWTRISGIGIQTWEWDDGIRSWVLPAYNGAWLGGMFRLGLPGGRALALLQLHWAMVSLTLVWAGWRGGRVFARRIQRGRSAIELRESAEPGSSLPDLGWQGGLLGAALCGLFPSLVFQAPHTISESPSMLALVWSVVLAAESSDEHDERRAKHLAGIAGGLAALGVCLRIANGPLALIPFAVVVIRRSRERTIWFSLWGIVPVIFFGAVDWATWGTFLGSYWGYVKFNFIKGGASQFGVSDRDWYVVTLFNRLPWGIAILGLPSLLAIRHTWPLVCSALGLVLYLSTQPHKEERFIVAFWPFLLIAAGATYGGWLARLSRHAKLRALPQKYAAFAKPMVRGMAGVLFVALVTWDGILHSEHGGLDVTQSLSNNSGYNRSLIEAQAWTGVQPNLTGAIIEQHAGGFANFGGFSPMVFTGGDETVKLLRNPIINYAIVMNDSDNKKASIAAGFRPIRVFGNYEIYFRSPRTE